MGSFTCAFLDTALVDPAKAFHLKSVTSAYHNTTAIFNVLYIANMVKAESFLHMTATCYYSYVFDCYNTDHGEWRSL